MDVTLKNEFKKFSKDQLIDFIQMASKNFWTLQNNWIFYVEKRFGHEAAVEMDEICYGRAMEVQAYRLKRFFNLKDDLASLIQVLKFSLFGLYADGLEYEVYGNRAIRRVRRCPMQLRRLKDGLPELHCKKALTFTASKIAQIINPDIKVISVMAPPDFHPKDLWCEIIYELS
jgi:hypothetical protein